MANIVLAGPGYTTYQAKIIKPDGYPLEANNVNFRFTILNPLGTCILYSENYAAVNMTGTGGVISFALGSGVKVFPASATTFAEVFSNITPALACDVGGPGLYNPGSSDVRKIVMQFHDGNGWQTLPAMNINAVPYAMYANDAQNLGGVSATSFVQRTEIPSCSGGEAMFYNGTNFSCVTLGGGAVSAAAITAALGYTPANGASITAVSGDVSSLASYAASVSSTVFSVSSTVTSLENSFSSFQATTAASFAAISGVGISTFNGSTSATQSLGNSLSGTTPAFVTANGVHTLNIPYASEGTTTAGLISNSEYSLFSTVINKITSSAASIAQVLGYTPADQATVTTLSSTVGAVSTTANSALALANAVSSSVNSLGSNKITSSAASVAEVLGFNPADQATVNAVSTTANTALTTANSKITSSAAAVEQVLGYVPADSAVLSSFQSTTTASFAAIAGVGISSLNGATSATQAFANGSAGTAPAFNTANGVHTLNIPFASAGATTAGLISNTDYSLFSTVINKITSSAASIAQVLGYTPADQAAVTTLTSTVGAVSATANSALALANAVSSSVNSLGSNKITSSAASVAEVLGYTPADQAAVTTLTSTVGAVSTTANTALATANSKITSSAAAIAQVLGYVPGPATGSTQWTTSGTAITYNSGNVGIGIANPRSKLNVVGSLGLMIGDWGGGTMMNQHQSIAQAPSSFTDSLAEKPFTLIGGNSFLDRSEVLIGGSTNMSSEAAAQNIIFYTHPTKDTAMGIERMRVASNGRVGIATNNPGYALEVSGTIASTNGGYRFPDNTTQTTAFVSGASGIAQQLGYVPASSATLSSFQAATVASLTALSGSGISAFNGSTSATQSLANGTAGNSPAFVSANGVHTLNIPFASAGATTAGLISNSDYSLFSTVINKITSSAASIAQVLGYTPADQAAVTTLSSTVDAVSTTANAALTAANTKITSSAASIAQVLGYTPAASGGVSSQWTTSGTTINYVAGNVGIGTTSPMHPLHVHKSAGGDPNVLLTDGDQVHPFSAYYSLIPANTVGYMANNHATGGGLALYGLTSNASTYGLSLNSYLGSASPTVAAFNIVGQKLNGGGATLLASDETLMIVRNLNNPVFTLKGSGNLGIGTTNPVTKLEVSGGLRISMESAACAVSYAGTLRYNAGNVEYCNGTTWTAFGAAGSGVGTFNGSTSSTQTLAAGTTGTAPSFSTVNGVHTLNIPYASAGTTTAGLISNTDYVNFSNKITSSAASIAQVLGYVPAATGAVNPWMALENSTNTSVGPYISFWKNRNYAATQANDELGSMSFYGHDGAGTRRSASIMSNAEGAPSTNSVPGYITFSTTTSGSTDVSEKMRITASGKVGIGTTNPAATFSVSGTTDIAAANIALPAVGSNGTSQLNNNTLDLSLASNYTIAGGGSQYAIGDKSIYTITSATTATDLSRLYLMGNQQVVNYAAAASTTQVIGTNLRTDANTAGAVSFLTGLALNTRMINSNAVNGMIRGVTVNSIAQGAGGATGSATDLYGVDSVVSIQGGNGANTFAVTNAFGLRSGVGIASSSGTINAAYGLYIDNGINATNTGTVTNQYGLFIEEQNLGTTNKWNILSQGVNSRNLFEGKIGLGEFSPSAYLHIGATSGTQASLKINSGTLLASPQPGAIEYDGTNLYYTDGSSTRRTLAAAGGGVGTFNGSTSATQTLAAGTAGTSPSFSTVNGVHTLNIPFASAGTTTAGLISNTDFLNFSNKITSSAASIAQVLGYMPAASGTSLTNFTESVNTAAPNATVPVVRLLANNAAANVDVALSPKGTGAITAHSADNTAAGGNKRGTNAVDWQTNRGLASNVAGAADSVIGGGVGNSIGAGSTGSVIAGGGYNVAGGSNNASIGGGSSNSAGGQLATVPGGYGNSAAAYGSIAMNYSTTANGQNSLTANYFTTSAAFAQAVFGAYNLPKGGETPNSWVTTDPLFTIGNGTGATSRSTAVMVLKNGNVGFGTNSPSAVLHLTSGTTTVAPLKLTSGSLLTTPASGSIEYDGFNFYATNGAGTRSSLTGMVSSQWTTSGTAIGYLGGSVGVGTASPRTAFDVAPATGQSIIRATSTNSTSALQLYRNTAGAYAGPVLWSNGTSLNFGYDTTENSGPTLMTLDTNGNLGVGISGSGAALEVYRNNGSDAAIALTNASPGNGAYITSIANSNFSGYTSTGVSQTWFTGQYGSRNYVIGDLTNGKIPFTITSNAPANSFVLLSSGTTGIGVAVPTAKLHIASGSTTVAPFKITSGALTTVAQAGSIEYDGFNFYTTNGAGTRTSLGGSGITSSAAAIAQVLGYTPAASGSGTSSKWTASGTTISYSTGNVGIGTATPTNILHVNGSAFYPLKLQNTSSGVGLEFTEVNSSGGAESIYATVNQLRFSTTGVDRFVIDSTGNIGFGVAAPTAVLHLKAGTTAANTAPLRFSSGTLMTAAQSGTIEYDGFDYYATDGSGTRERLIASVNTAPASGQVLAFNGTQWAPATAGGASQWNTSGTTINYTTGNVGVGTANPISNFQIHQPTGGNASLLKFTTVESGAANSDGTSLGLLPGGVDVQLWNYENGYFRIGTAGAERLRITSTGSVGIGTASPVGTLSIENATMPSIQMKKTGAAAVDTFNMINDMDTTGFFWFAKGTSATTAPTTASRLVAMTNAGNMEIYGQETNGSNDNSGVLALKTQKSTDGGTRNEVSMEFYADGANIDTPSGYLGYESNTVYDLALHNVKAGSLLFGTNNITRMSINSAGNVAVGLASATAKFHLAAGTTSLAPMKLTSGPLLTTPASGSIEYDGFNFYTTNGAGTRSVIGGGGSVTSATIATALGYSPVSSAAVAWTVSGTTLEYSGNVAIGSTIDPTTPLQVYGNANATPSVASSIFSTRSSFGTGIFMGSYNAMPFASWIQAADHTGFFPYSLVLSPQGGNVSIGNNNNPGSRLVVKGLGTTSATSALNVTDSANSSKLYVGNDGNVGVGTITPSAKMHILGDLNVGVQSSPVSTTIKMGGPWTGYGLRTWSLATEDGRFSIKHDLEAFQVEQVPLTILQNNNVGIGTASPSFTLDVQTQNAITARYMHSGNNANDGAAIMMTRTRGTLGVNFGAQAGDTIGGLYFRAHNGVDANVTNAAIEVEAYGTQSASNRANYMIFETTASGATTRAERMRISESGYVGIGTTNPYALLSIGPNGTSTQANLGYVGSYLTSGGQAQWGGNWASSGYWGIGPSTNAGDSAIRIGNMTSTGTWAGTQDAKLVIGSGGLGVGTAPATNFPLDILKASGDLTARFKADGVDTDIALHLQNDAQTWKILNRAGNSDAFIVEDTTASGKPSFYIAKSTGRIGIGQTSVAALTYQLEVSGTVAIASGSALRIGNNNICTSGGCTSSSDLRLKENIQPLDFSVEKLLSLNAVQYDWKDKVTYGDKHQIGFIAQELEKVYPEVVYTDKDSGLKSVSYGHLIAPLIEAFKVMYSKINDLFIQTEKNTRAIASLEEKDSAKDKQIEALKLENERKDKELREMKERLDRIEKALQKK